jgi:hypothetical protein
LRRKSSPSALSLRRPLLWAGLCRFAHCALPEPAPILRSRMPAELNQCLLDSPLAGLSAGKLRAYWNEALQQRRSEKITSFWKSLFRAQFLKLWKQAI